MRHSKILFAALLIVFSMVAFASAASINIKASHGSPLGSAPDEGWKKFKELIEARSGGEIAVRIYPNNQLGPDRETTESVQLGNLHMACPSSSILAPFSKDVFVLDLFFLFKDREMAYRVLDGEPGKTILASLEKSRLKGLGYMENGFRNLSNSKRPVRTPDDIAGLKIRVMENPLHIEAWNTLGASAIPMAFSEVLTSLQQGVLDAQENPYQNIVNSGFDTVQKFVIETGHLYGPLPLVYSKVNWDKLTPEQQKIILEAAEETKIWQREKQEEINNGLKQAIIKKGKTQIIELSDAEKDEFRKMLTPLYKKHAPQMGGYVEKIYKELGRPMPF